LIRAKTPISGIEAGKKIGGIVLQVENTRRDEARAYSGTTSGGRSPAKAKAAKLTDEQREIIGTSGKLVTVTAYAGTGKTTTLEAFARARRAEKMLYLVFNRSMAEESRRAFSECGNVTISTFHALAYKYHGKDYAGRLGNIRPYDLRRYMQKLEMQSNYEDVSCLFHIVQTFLMSADADIAGTIARLHPERKQEIAARRLDLQKLADAATEIWADMRGRELPMPHNGYLKLLQLEQVPLNYDWILVDEAQDISDCMINILTGAGKNMVLAGDPYQQIYGWNGAVNALGKMSGQGATRCYLTQSFRCPPDVASLADAYLQTLRAPKTFRCAQERRHAPGPVAALARTNLGLFDLIVDSDPAKTRIYYIGGFDSYEFRSLVDIYKLQNNELHHKIADRFIAHFGSFEEFNDYAENASDGTFKAKIQIVKKYGAALPKLYYNMTRKQAARTTEADLIVSTAHRVKGKEFESVRLHGDFMDLHDLIHRAARKKKREPIKASAEELHLVYVALTRSMGKVTFPGYLQLQPSDVQAFRELVAAGDIELV
jgi:superfamily I DNA/RNA helicase